MLDLAWTLLGISGLFCAVSLLRFAVRTWERKRVRCPERAAENEDIVVVRRLNAGWTGGPIVDVHACSVFGPSAKVRCDKACLRPFAT